MLRPKPKRLIGDSPALRGRFLDQYPTIRIDTAPGSAYRAWLNAQRRGRTKNAPRLGGDTPLVRAAFLREKCPDTVPHPDYWHTPGTSYTRWLREHGIDATTGKMTAAGVAFFRTLLDEQNARNRAKRGSRRAA